MSGVALRAGPEASLPGTSLFGSDFAANGADLPGAGLGWLDARRATAMEAFGKTGVPTRRVEAWKYTDLAQSLEAGLEPATHFHGSLPEQGFDDPFATAGAARFSLVNGFFHRAPGDLADAPHGLDIVDLGKLNASAPDWVKDHLGQMAAGQSQVLGAASLGLMRGGLAIRVRAGTQGAVPLHLDFVNPPRGRALAQHARILIVLEAGATLHLLESHGGAGGEQILANIGMEFVLKEGARLEHVRLQNEAPAALHVTSLGATLAGQAEYRAHYANLGAQLSRLDVLIRLGAPGAKATLNSVTALSGSRLADLTTVMDHASPHTTSRQLFKSVLGDSARSVSQGRVVVREGAVKSDSHQLFKALLLGPRAEADAKPELEIFADDVVCGHGTAIGALDRDALFYLRSRGIAENEARGLLVHAFLEDAMTSLDDALREALWRPLDAALAQLGRDEA